MGDADVQCSSTRRRQLSAPTLRNDHSASPGLKGCIVGAQDARQSSPIVDAWARYRVSVKTSAIRTSSTGSTTLNSKRFAPVSFFGTALEM